MYWWEGRLEAWALLVRTLFECCWKMTSGHNWIRWLYICRNLSYIGNYCFKVWMPKLKQKFPYVLWKQLLKLRQDSLSVQGQASIRAVRLTGMRANAVGFHWLSRLKRSWKVNTLPLCNYGAWNCSHPSWAWPQEENPPLVEQEESVNATKEPRITTKEMPAEL